MSFDWLPLMVFSMICSLQPPSVAAKPTFFTFQRTVNFWLGPVVPGVKVTSAGVRSGRGISSMAIAPFTAVTATLFFWSSLSTVSER